MAFTAGCHTAPTAQVSPPPPPPPPSNGPTCADAGIALDTATRDLRAPDQSFAPAMRQACIETTWSDAAIACFAHMKADDLKRCTGLLAEPQRRLVFDTIGGTDRGSVAVALVKLAGMETGIPACDHFIATVALVLGCDAMPLDTRVQLGVETADSWSLPASTHLSADMLSRMGASCQQSLDVLVAEAHRLGCM